jgi:glucose-6-phosphate-specific signal transduction histidine kinase
MSVCIDPDDIQQSQNTEQSRCQIIKDSIWVLSITLSTYLIAGYLDLAERYINWATLGEIYQLDELIFVLLAGCVSLVWFSLRRIQALRNSLEINLDMQQKLHASNNHIRRLLKDHQTLIKQMILARESEQRQLAKELHDVFGQHLAAMDANLTVALHLTQDPQMSGILNAVMESTSHLRAITRNKLRHLKPPSLDSIGLSGAIHELLNDWRQSLSDMTVDAQIELDDHLLSEDIALTAYRSLQEGLANIRQHADASMVSVTVRQEQENDQHQLILQLEDNGKGLPPDYTDKGLGLIGIREYVQALGGSLQLSTITPSGTRLALRLPYQPLTQ